MASLSSSKSLSSSRLQARQQKLATPAVAPTASRRVVVARAQAQPETSRRQLLSGAAAALVAAAALLPAQPAAAGFFGNDDADKAYTDDTTAVLSEMREALAFDRADPDLDAKVKKVRGDINAWVAKYRRNTRYEGRPSYGNTYSVCNALAGHYNSFGNEAAVPKKRLERIVKELGDAEGLLARGR